MNASTVNEERQSLISQSLESLEHITPTYAALTQHIERKILVVSFIWHEENSRQLSLPNFADFGWEWNERTKCEGGCERNDHVKDLKFRSLTSTPLSQVGVNLTKLN